MLYERAEGKRGRTAWREQIRPIFLEAEGKKKITLGRKTTLCF